MLLSVENLKVSYGKIPALHGLNFEIEAGEIVTIIGANGAGKSTTLRAISRMVPALGGSKMTFDGKDLLSYSPEKVVSELGLTHVPEGRRLFGNLTVLENLELATFSRTDREAVQRGLKAGVRDFRAPGRAQMAKGGHAFRRRAADAGRGPRLHERAPHDASGRGLPWAWRRF